MNVSYDFVVHSFDTDKKLWETRAPVPFVASDFEAIEMNGSLYVAGDRYDALVFYCYDAEQDLWSEKASVHTGEEIKDPALFKVKERICFYDRKNGFQSYNSSLNQWTKVKHI